MGGIYNTRSIKQALGRVIRNTRITDATFGLDLLEWAGEGVDRLQVNNRLPKSFYVITTENYISKIPCGVKDIDGVFYNGARLRRGLTSITPEADLTSYTSTVDTFFQTDTVGAANQQDYNIVRGLNLKEVAGNGGSTSDYYIIDFGYLKTSFKTGKIVVFCKYRPTDKQGYPLVPDLEEAEEAIFWYLTSKLVFAGFKLPDPRIDFAYCDAKAAQFFRRAKNIIKSSSEDEIESAIQLNNNLVPADYYEEFFKGAEQAKSLDFYDNRFI